MRNEVSRRNSLLKKARGKIAGPASEAVLVSDRYDISYLTGFFTAGAMIMLSAKGRPVYFVDSMNHDLARKMLDGIEIDLKAGSLVKELSGCVRDRGIKKLGIDEDNLPASIYTRLSGTGRNLKIWRAPGIVRKMRAIKGREEIEIMRRTAGETVRIWKDMKKRISPGMSELELMTMLDISIRSRGYDNSFPAIIAVGENSAYPHAIPSDRKLGRDEHVLIDFGIRFRGYCSDLTRIWAKGRINRKIRELEKFVDCVRDRTLKRLKPGADIGSLVKRANKFFYDNDLGKYILHGLGHGVGLDIHEIPFLGEASGERLRKGMVVAIEPGLYMPGVGGIRKEDMVLITAKGCEVLTQ
ncbi:MAG: aminopeptidase P family protein [Candidatus Omnitrophica bacterium]|nr:aminopeptidase P family protein [Candidatus Omnitrophota bacterium]